MPIPSIMNNTITRFGATIITTATILAGAAPAMAQPNPYGRGDALTAIHAAQPDPYERGRLSPQNVAKVVRHARMVPRPGARRGSSPCGTPSKAARFAHCG